MEDPTLITAKTLEHYNERATEFWTGTRDHDVKQNIDALLRHVRAAPPLRILDFGCGPGRDLAAFRALGHEPIGLEGSPQFAAMAREHSGCEVWEQDFVALQLPSHHFDGIFANASLFHVPRRELPRVLSELYAALKPDGVLFSSNPRGNNEEGWNRGRYGAYYDLESWRSFLQTAGFAELEHYYRPPGLPLEQQAWLATVCKKAIVSRRSNQLFRFSAAVKRDPAIDAWMREHAGELGAIAEHWFEIMRASGDDIREILHDGHPTACVGDAAFAYVNAFTAHVNVGFFRGAELADPASLLVGTGKYMRHVKVRLDDGIDAKALMELIEAAYNDMKGRL